MDTFAITGKHVSRLGFGTIFLTAAGSGANRPTATNAPIVLRRAVELGAQFIDIADFYGPIMPRTSSV